MGHGIACPGSAVAASSSPPSDHRVQDDFPAPQSCRASAVWAQEEFWGGIEGAATEHVQLMDSKLVTVAKICNCYIYLSTKENVDTNCGYKVDTNYRNSPQASFWVC